MSIGSLALRLRAILFWCHLAVGATAGVVILIMSVTGAALGFERQIVDTIDGRERVSVPTAATRLPLDSLLARAAAGPASNVGVVVIKRDAAEPVTLRFQDRERAGLSIDPYTGAALPHRAPGRAQGVMQELRRWHRFVGQQDPRSWGRTTTGVANFAFFLLVLSGLYLWFPSRWTRAILRSLTVPAFRLTPKAREFNWHHVAGIWMWVPLVIVVGSGVFMSFEWPTQWLASAMGAAVDPARAASRTPAQAAAVVGTATRTTHAALEPMLQAALQRRPEWTQLQLVMPGLGDSDVTVTVSGGNTFRPDLRTVVTRDASSGAIRTIAGLSDLPFARRVRGWIRFAHTGEVLGFPGQLIATLASLAGVLLVYTGIALSLRRFTAWRARRARDATGA